MDRFPRFTGVSVFLTVALVAATGRSEPYRVKRGDTLSAIAAKHHISLRRLEVVNHIHHPNRIAVGSVLIVPELSTHISHLAGTQSNSIHAPASANQAGAHDGTVAVTGLVSSRDNARSQDRSSGIIPVPGASGTDGSGPDSDPPSPPQTGGGDSQDGGRGRSSRPPGSPSGGNGLTPAPYASVHQASQESSGVHELRAGLASGWIVTRNSSGMLFVHKSQSGGYLRNLRYLIRENSNPDGSATWTIYEPAVSSIGTHKYGRIVGVIDRPNNIDVGPCGCQ